MRTLVRSTVENLNIVPLRPEYFPEIAKLEIECYPTIPRELIGKVENLASHHRIFPEGDFVALLDGVVVGYAGGLFVDFDIQKPDHTMCEIDGNGLHTTHDPSGAYYYGTDIFVRADCRGTGIARKLYDERKNLVRRYNKRGMLAGSIVPGFEDFRTRLNIDEYVEQVRLNQVFDPALSTQLNNGFEILTTIENYYPNEDSNGACVLIYWENTHFRSDESANVDNQ